ncbi:MAG: methylmalonyl-CoA epimerase [Chloroflexi bacterium]|nr:methylmalonyl-CoA epimerase [Chloroflexota bacterium]
MNRRVVAQGWPPSLDPGDPGGVHDLDRLPDERARTAFDLAVVRLADLRGPATKAELLDRIASDLEFPAWFGRNWDALDDLLIDDDGRAILVFWHDVERLPAADRSTARSIFADAARARQEAGLRPLIVWMSRSTPHEDPPMPSSATRVPDRIRGLGKVHHVALIVASIEVSLGLWRDLLGLELESVMNIPPDRVRIAFLAVGESKVELVQPTDDSTGVARFLASHGEGFHHVCFEVANLAETLLRLEIDGLELIDTVPRRGAEGPVAFIHPRSCHGVLVELIEAAGGPSWTSLGF